MIQRINYIIICVFVCFPAIAIAAIYKMTDPSGNIRFSDQPTERSEIMTLQSINTFAENINPRIDTNRRKITNQKNMQSENYKEFLIQQPKDQQTFFNQSDIEIQINLQPKLYDNNKIGIWLDGQLVKESTQTKIKLENVERGEHRLQAKVLGETGNPLITSNEIIFYVNQILMKS